MAKVQIKSEKLTPFGEIFSIMEQFDSMLSPIIDQTLGQRCRSIIGCLVIQRQKRMDGVLDLLEGEYTYRCIRLQLHLRTCQVDHDSKAIRAEYLHREPSLCKTLQNWIRIKSVPYGFNLRIASSRIVG